MNMRDDIKKILDDAKVLILDIETDSLDIKTASVKVVGVRTNKNDKVHCIWAEDFDKLRKAIKKSDFVVTYNGNNFDVPVLTNDVNKLFKYESSIKGKHIDLYDVIKKRESTFKVHFDNFKLDTVCEALGLDRKVDDFDYTLLQKEVLTATEKAEIERYLRQDINITYDLYMLIESLYDPLTEFLPKDDIVKKKYITASMGAMTYKIICHLSGIEPIYNDSDDNDNSGYKGGLVISPTQESASGRILCADFTSAYPHAFMQANLYTKCKYCKKGECKYRFTGATYPNGDVLELQGAYCQKGGMGDREKAIKKLFALRMKADCHIKNNDGDVAYFKKLKQALKIVINTIYGISGSPKFVQTYDIDTASDCTHICRFNLEYLHKRISSLKHIVLYGDTDSCYFISQYDENVVDKQLKVIANEIKSVMPQPQDTFNIELEDTMSYIRFFYDDRGVSKKKQYIKLMANGDVEAKGLAIIKRDSSFLARKIWNDKIVPDIQEKGKLDIKRTQIELWIDEMLTADMSVAKIEFNVKPLSEYATDTSIQAILSKELGPGKHSMVKTTRTDIGYGKNVKYVTLEQAKDMSIKDIDLTRVWSDLKDLINKEQMTFEYFMV
jgi:DNA polymerase elongation subunit (family B)